MLEKRKLDDIRDLTLSHKPKVESKPKPQKDYHQQKQLKNKIGSVERKIEKLEAETIIE